MRLHKRFDEKVVKLNLCQINHTVWHCSQNEHIQTYLQLILLLQAFTVSIYKSDCFCHASIISK